MNIVLTGFMGTGKTIVGLLVAQKLGWKYIDVDNTIEKERGCSISEIFAEHGETHFRSIEAEAIKKLCSMDKIVLSCGGGAVLKKENITNLEKNGIIVCLKASAEAIYDRVKKDRSRPLLQVEDPLSKIKDMLKAREPFYKRCSFSVDTTSKTPAEITEAICNHPSISSLLSK